jgi:carboxymethylenebutenolidase
MPVPGAVTDPSAVAGEEVRFAGAGGDEIGGYLARPTDDGDRPGVIVIHEAFGLNDHIRDVARRFAAVGHTALAPDLYSREGTPDTGDMRSVFEAMYAQPDERIVGDLEGAARTLGERDDATGAVGCVGFCSGGRQTLLFACNTERLSAAIDCWGGFTLRASADEETTPLRPVTVGDQLARLSCPALIVVGADDQNPTPQDGERLVELARAAGRDARLTVYEDAGHAFFADYRPNYREAPAHRLWDEMTAFFAQRLAAR